MVKDLFTLQDLEKYGFDVEAISQIIEQMTIVLDYGAQTYGLKNWQLTSSMPSNCKAAKRHICQSLDGIEHDIDTECHPLYHALCRILFAICIR